MQTDLIRQKHVRPMLVFAGSFTLACLCCVIYFSCVQPLPRAIMAAAAVLCAVSMLLPKALEFYMLPIFAFGAGIAFYLIIQQSFFEIPIKYDGYSGVAEIIITQEPVSRGTYSSAVGEITKIGEDTTKFKAQIYLEDASPYTIKIGNCYRGNFAIKEAPREVERRYVQKQIFLFASQKGNMELVEQKGTSLKFWGKNVAAKVTQSYSELLGEGSAALMSAIITGDKTMLSPQMRQNSVDSGTAHITAVSGLHVSLLLGLIVMIFGISRGTKIALPIVVLYVIIVGFTPSSIRAAVMIFFSAGAMMAKRQNDTLTALGGAILFLTLINPYSLLDVGLQLSFASVFGLVVLLPHMHAAISRRLQSRKVGVRLVRFVLGSFATSACAMVFTLPILCINFPAISVVSILGNLLILPVIAPIIACGALMPMLFYTVGFGAGAVAFIADLLLKYVAFIQAKTASLPFATVPSENIFVALFCFVTLFLAIYFISRKKNGIRVVAAGVLVAVSCMAFAIVENNISTSISIINSSGGAVVMANSGGNVNAFYSGEFIADSYFSTSQTVLDKMCTSSVTSLLAFNTGGLPIIDSEPWETLDTMIAPEGFNTRAYVGNNALKFSGDGEREYEWGGARWTAMGENYAAQIEIEGVKLALACGVKPNDFLNFALKSNMKCDYLIVNSQYLGDAETLSAIREQVSPSSVVCMVTPFVNVAEGTQNDIAFLDEYDEIALKARK